MKPLGKKVTFARDEYDALKGATRWLPPQWNQFQDLDWTAEGLLRQPYFFDLRNIYRRGVVEAKGLRYFGVGQ